MQQEAHSLYRFERFSDAEMRERSATFFKHLNLRRSIRSFSPDPIPMEVVENAIRTAGTAPSGAHKQPWTFCVVTNASLKSDIRRAAEEEERKNYNGRMTEEWLKDLAPLGTDEHKPFLDIAPVLIVVFKKIFEDEQGTRKNYYVNESVGIATGMLLTALHNAGLATLTHTPSPMNFLERLLGRPANERAFLLIPVGFPAADATVPNLDRKPVDEILIPYF